MVLTMPRAGNRLRMQPLTYVKHKGVSRLKFTLTPTQFVKYWEQGLGPDQSFKARKMILLLSAGPESLSKV